MTQRMLIILSLAAVVAAGIYLVDELSESHLVRTERSLNAGVGAGG